MSGFQLRPTPTASNHPPAAGVSGVSATPAKTTTTTMMPTPLQKTPGGISTVGSSQNTFSTFSLDEKEAFSQHINTCLGDDAILKRHLPLDSSSMDLFTKSHDGLIMCKLINLAQFDAIDERAINIKENLNVYQKTENQNLVLNAAKAIGCQVINIGAQDLIDGKPILILGLIWQIIKIQLLSQISLRNVPELVLLLEEGEEMSDFMKLPPEVILLRWLNWHLKRAKSSIVVKNFGHDLSDSSVYSIVLNRLGGPDECPLITDESLLERATKAIAHSKNIGADVFLKPKDICDGNKKLNVAMVAQLFNTNHGLKMDEVEKKRRSSIIMDLDKLVLVDDAGDSREERVFRMWINSCNIDGSDIYVNDLFAEIVDGVILLKIINLLRPGMVNNKKISLQTSSRFKKVANANYVVELGRLMKLSLINIGGIDIVDGNKKLILAIIWQLMRLYSLEVLGSLAAKTGISNVTEEHILAWANDTVKASGQSSCMKSFRDQTVKSSLFLLELVAAIEPRAVDWTCVKKVDPLSLPVEDQLLNAKYVISCARKVGALVFLTPEDIIEVKSKMLMTFLSSLWQAKLKRQS